MGRRKKEITDEIPEVEVEKVEEEIIPEEVIPKKSSKIKHAIKTVRVRLLVSDSVVNMKSENGYIDIPENNLEILERHGIVKRVK